MQKTCSRCGVTFPLNSENFQLNRQAKDGFRPDCKPCRKLIYLENTIGRKRKSEYLACDGVKKCFTCNSMKDVSEFTFNAKGSDKLHYDCRSCTAEKRKSYREKDPKKFDSWSAKWKSRNQESYKESSARYLRERRMNPEHKLKTSIHNLVNQHLQSQSGITRGGKFWGAIGYGPKELIAHLEGLFADGMSWGNRGEWEIDHIIPQSHFHFSSYEDIEFIDCWKLSNLRPLWKPDNRLKSNSHIA